MLSLLAHEGVKNANDHAKNDGGCMLSNHGLAASLNTISPDVESDGA